MHAIDATGQSTVETAATRLHALARYLLVASGRDVFAEVERLGLSLSQLKVLQLLDDREVLSIKAIGDTLGLSLAGVSRGVDGLVKRGFVKRAEDPGDRRSKLVSLTAKGSRTMQGIGELRLAGLRTFVAALDSDQVTALAEGLEPLMRVPEIAALLEKA